MYHVRSKRVDFGLAQFEKYEGGEIRDFMLRMSFYYRCSSRLGKCAAHGITRRPCTILIFKYLTTHWDKCKVF